jgi:hypothetical protein
MGVLGMPWCVPVVRVEEIALHCAALRWSGVEWSELDWVLA